MDLWDLSELALYGVDNDDRASVLVVDVGVEGITTAYKSVLARNGE